MQLFKDYLESAHYYFPIVLFLSLSLSPFLFFVKPSTLNISFVCRMHELRYLTRKSVSRLPMFFLVYKRK